MCHLFLNIIILKGFFDFSCQISLFPVDNVHASAAGNNSQVPANNLFLFIICGCIGFETCFELNLFFSQLEYPIMHNEAVSIPHMVICSPNETKVSLGSYEWVQSSF